MLVLAMAMGLAGAVVDGGTLVRAIERLPDDGTATGGGVELVVDPRGKVRSCTVIATVGGPEVADEMCGGFDSARLRPAVGADGAPAYGLVRVFAQSSPAAAGHRAWRNGVRPDVEVSLSSRPEGMPADGFGVASVAVDAAGAVTACHASADLPAGLAAATCDAARTLTFAPMQAPGGSAVPFVSTVAVRFLTS